MRYDPSEAEGGVADPAPDKRGNEFYIAGWCRFFDFLGVASRTEYWSFKLINLVVFVALAIIWASTAPTIDGELQFNAYGYATVVFILATAIPEFAVAVRRVRDATGSGWWVLVPIVSLVVLFMPTRSWNA